MTADTFFLFLILITCITGILWIFDFLRSLKVIKRFMLFYVKDKYQKYFYDIQPNNNDKKNNWFSSCASIFPVLLIVLVFRSFCYEPFQIPSGSMMPTLLVGDFILVEKFSYGLRNPITHSVFLKTGKPKRGDIVVFKYPLDTSINFVKRVIGIGGDKIIYNSEKKELCIYPNYLNNNELSGKLPIFYSLSKKSEWALFLNFQSTIANQTSNSLVPLNKILPDNAIRYDEKIEKFKNKDHKIYIISGLNINYDYQQVGLLKNEWIVPYNHYFMMGDNRDNSSDSRMWGFVPETNLVGRVIMIWFSLNKQEGQWPNGIRLERIGKIN